MTLLSWLVVGRWLLLLPLMLVATGCFWGDESETRYLIGNYYLNSVPSEGGWYLHFDEEESGLADALINSKIAEASFAKKVIVLRVATADSQFYIVPLSKASAMESREAARNKIIGPLSRTEFQATVRRLNDGLLVPFNPKITSFE